MVIKVPGKRRRGNPKGRWLDNVKSDKSKEMLISFMQDPEFRNTVPRFKIDGNEIDNVQYAKRLGVTDSQHLLMT